MIKRNEATGTMQSEFGDLGIDSYSKTKDYSDLAQNNFRTASILKRNLLSKTDKKNEDEIFSEQLNLINSSIDQYYAQTLIQAAESYKLTKTIAIFGFIILIIGIIIVIISPILNIELFDIGLISLASGLIIEFISAIFFYIFNKSLEQMNIYHEKLFTSQSLILSFIAEKFIKNDNSRDNSVAEIIKIINSRSKE